MGESAKVARRALGPVVALAIGASPGACGSSASNPSTTGATAADAASDAHRGSASDAADAVAQPATDATASDATGGGSHVDAVDGAATDAPEGPAPDSSTYDSPPDGSDGSPSDATTTPPSDGSGGSSTCPSGLGALTAVWPLPNVTPSAIATDAAGNVYLAGSFSGTVMFGTTSLVSAGGVDMFLAKLDLRGNLLWVNRYGNNDYDDASPALAVDGSGNVYLGGGFGGTLSFGGSSAPLAAVGYTDAFVVKIATNGATVWADRFGYNQGPYWPSGIAIAPDGDPVVAGTAEGTIVFGSKTWTETAATDQPFALKLRSSDGSVVWSADGGGSLDTDHVSVAVDSAGRTFVVGRVLSGAGDWGAVPASAGSNFVTFRVGLDVNGVAQWSQFDVGGFPMGAAIDAEGRLAVVEDIGTATPYLGAGTMTLLSSPIDGTILSSALVAAGANTFPWALATDAHGNTVIAGQYSGTFTFGPSSFSSGAGAAYTLFVGALDGLSRAEGAQSLGTNSDNVQPYSVAVAPSGAILVFATAGTAFTTPVGMVPAAAFVAVYAPDACDLDAGPWGASTGDASNHGDLPLDGSTYRPSDASPAACPATQPQAVNGAACPVAIGCDYSGTCCFCSPNSCGAQPTTWTCDPLGTPAAGCPSSPPAAGTSCPSGLQCNYCLSGGRSFANCQPGGWQVGYAQVVCN